MKLIAHINKKIVFTCIFSVLVLFLMIITGIYVKKYVDAQSVTQNELRQTLFSLQEAVAQQNTQIVALTDNFTESLKNTQSENAKLSETIEKEKLLRVQSESELKANLQQKESIKNDVAVVISEWRPRIAHIACSWTSGRTAQGSGLLLGNINGGYKVQTNKHVVYDDTRKAAPTTCTVRLPEDQAISITEIKLHDNDSATITVSNPSSKMKLLSASIMNKACATKPSVGNGLVILGYPGIGSPKDITATEGIVSGFEGDYYITSAKIEQGNSGGAAIAIANNCYMGIPTMVRTGKVESLGRILDWRALHIN